MNNSYLEFVQFFNVERVCVIKGDTGKEAADDLLADKTCKMLLSSVTVVSYQLINPFRCFDNPVICTDCCQSWKMSECKIFGVSIFMLFH